MAFKLKAVRYAEKHNNSKASKDFNVIRRQIHCFKPDRSISTGCYLLKEARADDVTIKLIEIELEIEEEEDENGYHSDLSVEFFKFLFYQVFVKI